MDTYYTRAPTAQKIESQIKKLQFLYLDKFLTLEKLLKSAIKCTYSATVELCTPTVTPQRKK